MRRAVPTSTDSTRSDGTSRRSKPANREVRGLEIVTNGKDNAAYWQSRMAITGTTCSTRYVT
ncbi:restriction endonuclease fold toxin-2 domain-containing protein [Streptomyces katrae]|uniref:restriction endonuclease fold toxin-2 domain-containing protein n=1 Tax=Streptomyces katrae TaxID=68223 RepID=UPI003AEFDE8E